ncbi:CheR family methyltransferase [Rubripirellula reticaptiva]|uniref:protein-glutamate O-methyltransferase n=1 Tax=Rubripirellula reticaptiva TaxID=2528013 RepID=A0A5C6ETB5_9BACT|nr:protein-glutamate O-methyltransferase CheR [Rubripirellula reticaptiva]TWU51935.1 Chemotaxis protein methyltransferase Cher2 [Rubripirellula reticaptiva]
MSIETATTPSFDYISQLIVRKSAIVIDPGKNYLVESRLLPVARAHGMASLDELVQALQKPGAVALVDEVVDAMTTNESSFFRDLHPFNALREEVIPSLISRRSKERVLNVWSNACSSGQEVYSIAMLIREHFPELAGWRVRLTATDLSKQILQKAQSGIYTQTEINRGLPMPMLLKYFQRDGMHWRISDEIRRMVEFKALNLIEPWPSMLPKMDIVFLRNVLIYFSVDTKKQILDKVHRVMQSDGALFLGGAESTMNLNVKFDRKIIGKATTYLPI